MGGFDVIMLSCWKSRTIQTVRMDGRVWEKRGAIEINHFGAQMRFF